MKARVKATGEIIEVIRRIVQGRDYLEYVWYYRAEDRNFKEWELEFNINNIDKDEPDYWTKLHHQAAIAAMQGMLSNSLYMEKFIKYAVQGDSLIDVATQNAFDYATALVNRLKEVQK